MSKKVKYELGYNGSDKCKYCFYYIAKSFSSEDMCLYYWRKVKYVVNLCTGIKEI